MSHSSPSAHGQRHPEPSQGGQCLMADSVSSTDTAWAQLLSACLRALSCLVAMAFYMEKASRFLLVVKGPHSSGSSCEQCLFGFVEVIYMGASDIFPIILELQDLVRV